MRNLGFRALITASFLTTALVSTTFAKPVCVEVSGESAVIGGDLPSAKVEAINRAKFAAVEQVAGVDIKSKTVVEDSALLDDMITTQTRGAVSSYKIIRESHEGDSARALVNVCVEPLSAKSAMSALALNTAISVYLPAKKLVRYDNLEYDDENILAQAVIGKLAEGGFSVRDLAETHSLKLRDIDMALKGGDQTSVRSLVYRYLTNSVLIGKIEPTVSMRKGSDAGYGISMPFNSVTARLSYRLMTRDNNGKMVVLSAGSEEAKGMAPSQDDAYAEALKNLSEKFVPIIIDKIHSRLNDIASKVTIEVEEVKDPAETFDLRDQIQKVTWVTKVEEKGIGEFLVSYPENPIYLANGLSQKGFKIVSYTRDLIKIRRQ
ncbi:MAG: hypothetical protein A2X82_19290 [Geobacteraceae bacterium GWC2_55_20]|nr:MAG: hypothetical protein A2X82_19290 [Geobacteraceae bacterium GWC2_55_20]HBA71807.1 hypothetical protein [Geobacter sp.]HCE66186.1 hypothetical protein [Geobacter sp.]